jgi:uncharacterized protein
MAFPPGIPVIDTMIGFPHEGFAQYDFIRRQTRDRSSREEMEFPVEYIFTGVPKDLPTDDPIAVTLGEMDKYGIGSVRALRREFEDYGIRATSVFPSGTFPQVPIDDPKMYPIYQTCVDLSIPIFVCAGVPGPRLKFAPQEVARIDTVMYDFPELVFVTRHGCEPWEELAVKLMLKWPNLYYSTSAFAPKHYPRAIINYANTRGADKIIYAGYFPMGLSLERIFRDLPGVPFKDEVWPRFLHENARRVLKLDAP